MKPQKLSSHAKEQLIKAPPYIVPNCPGTFNTCGQLWRIYNYGLVKTFLLTDD